MAKLMNCACASLALIVFSIVTNGCTSTLIVGGLSTASSGATNVSGFGPKVESYQIADYKSYISSSNDLACENNLIQLGNKFYIIST